MNGSPRQKILLTNDDGFENKEGVQSLFLLLSKDFQVTPVVPLYEQSGTSQSISILSPIFVKQTGGFYTVRGTPSDCVKIGLGYIMKALPDFVVSGINAGSNIGLDVFYSGTVGAAIESSFWGITSFAVSVEKKHPADRKIDYTEVAKITRDIIAKLIKSKPLKGSVFNINIPKNIAKIKGVRFTAQDLHLVKDNFIKGIDPRGRHFFWMKSGHSKKKINKSNQSGFYSDIAALKSGYITITPLKADYTDQAFLHKNPD